jgi:hypothetical protein
VMLGEGPGDVGGPSSAAAITQALRWLNPPRGTILHVRSVETRGSQTTTREFWQSADHPDSERLLTEGAHTFETSGDALYDPATDTIYDASASPRSGDDATKAKQAPGAVKITDDAVKVGPGGVKVADGARKVPAGRTSVAAKPGDSAMPAGDPIVDKVRILLQRGRMVVTGREIHHGTDAWAISLKAGVGRPVWTLWVSADDGKPLELQRSRPRRERAAAGHPLADLRGAARRRRGPAADARGRPPVGTCRA